MLDKNSTLALQIKNILITMFSLSCSWFKCQYVVELAPKKNLKKKKKNCQAKKSVVDPFIIRTVLHFIYSDIQLFVQINGLETKPSL